MLYDERSIYMHYLTLVTVEIPKVEQEPEIDKRIQEELNKLIEKEFTIPRMEVVRDIFVFCSLTGLAFTDVQHLKPEHIFRDMDGSYWIRKTREKTDNMCNIPLLDLPLKLIQKYQNHPNVSGKVL